MAVGAGEIAPGNAGKGGALRGIRSDRRAQPKVRRKIYRCNPIERERSSLVRRVGVRFGVDFDRRARARFYFL